MIDQYVQKPLRGEEGRERRLEVRVNARKEPMPVKGRIYRRTPRIADGNIPILL